MQIKDQHFILRQDKDQQSIAVLHAHGIKEEYSGWNNLKLKKNINEWDEFDSSWVAVTLSRKHLLHVTYRLFYLSLSLQLASLFLHCTSLGQFAINGVGIPWMSNTGKALMSRVIKIWSTEQGLYCKTCIRRPKCSID